MNFGNVVSGGGAVARGYRDQEALIRKAREDELRLQAMNRANTLYKQAAAEEQMANTAAAVEEAQRSKFPVGTRPVAPPPRRAAGVQPGIPAAKNVTTTLNPAASKPAALPAPEKPQMTQQEFLRLSPEKRAQLVQQENDRRGVKATAYGVGMVPATLADMATMPFRGWGMIGQGVANSRVGRALGLSDVGDPHNFVDYTTSPLAESAQAGFQRNKKILTEDDYLATLPSRQPGARRGGSAAARRKNAQAGLAIPGGMPSADALASEAVGENPYPNGSVEADVWRAQKVQFTPEQQQTLDEVTGGDADAKWFLETVLRIENRGKPQPDDNAVSPAGAEGSFQFMPATAKSFGVTDRRDFRDSAAGAMRYFQELRDRYGPTARYAWLADYNGGPSNGKLLADARSANNPETERYLDIAYGLSQGPLPGAVATLASTGRPEAVSGPGVPAAPAGAAGPAAAATVPAVPAPQAAGVAVPDAAMGRPPSKAQFYLANPAAITAEMAQAQDARAQLVRMGNLQLQLRTAEGYEKAQAIKAQIRELDAGMVDLQGIQGVQDWEMANDPGRLERALSLKTGQDVGVKMFTDGSIDLYINGQLAHENVDPGEFKDQALSLFDQGYRAQKAERATESHKRALEAQIEQLKGGMETFRTLAKAQIEGQTQAWIEKFKAENRAWDVKIDADTGNYVFVPPGNRPPLIYNPAGREIQMGDSKILLTGAKEVPGLKLP